MTHIAQMSASERRSRAPGTCGNPVRGPASWIPARSGGAGMTDDSRAQATRAMLRGDRFTSPLARARVKRFATKPAFFTAAAGMNRIGRTKSRTPAGARKLHPGRTHSVNQMHERAHVQCPNAHQSCTKEQKLDTNLHKPAQTDTGRAQMHTRHGRKKPRPRGRGCVF